MMNQHHLISSKYLPLQLENGYSSSTSCIWMLGPQRKLSSYANRICKTDKGQLKNKLVVPNGEQLKPKFHFNDKVANFANKEFVYSPMNPSNKRPSSFILQGGRKSMHVHGRTSYANEAMALPTTRKNLQVSNSSRPKNEIKSVNYPDPFSHDISQSRQGLGIIDFLEGKHIFITGATGFLAKVLVEKILRVQPNVGQLYLLIKAKDINSANERLKKEIIYSTLFMTLRSQHGHLYDKFTSEKITPIVGNIAMDNLGLDSNMFEFLCGKIDIVINSAASTAFDERYDHALDLNTNGPKRMLDFSKRCQHLQLLMHVSTAFVNGTREGVVQEKSFKAGHSIARESSQDLQKVDPDLNIEIEMEIVAKAHDIFMKELEHSSLQKNEIGLVRSMKDLGMQRAQKFGWQDTYVFTKAMGEMVIDSMREHLPVVIIRPSVVESSFEEPFPGWMEGNRMMDPIIVLYGKGQLPGFLADAHGVLDVVPVDMVANAMLAAMAKNALKHGLQVYQMASSMVNPLSFRELAKASYEHFQENPFVDKHGHIVKPRSPELFDDIDSFINSVSTIFKEEMEKCDHTKEFGRHNLLISKAKEQACYLASLYKTYTFYAGRFDSSNIKQLFGELSNVERDLFKFDVSKIKWESYIKNTHIPGLRKHVLKGRGSF